MKVKQIFLMRELLMSKQKSICCNIYNFERLVLGLFFIVTVVHKTQLELFSFSMSNKSGFLFASFYLLSDQRVLTTSLITDNILVVSD